MEGSASLILPKVTGKIVTDFIIQRRILPRPELLGNLCEWARQNLK